MPPVSGWRRWRTRTMDSSSRSGIWSCGGRGRSWARASTGCRICASPTRWPTWRSWSWLATKRAGCWLTIQACPAARMRRSSGKCAAGSSSGPRWPSARPAMDAKGKAVRGRRREEFRPTLARVRDAVLNSLRGRVGGAGVLDLYAGSGAFGIEALRQGAERAVFVEHNAKLVTEIRRRLIGEELAGRAEVWRRDALAAVRGLGMAGRRVETIFPDPPPPGRLISARLRRIGTAGILAPGGVVAAEGHWRDRPSDTGGFVCRREARYGETMVWYFERAGGDTS